MMLYLGEFPLQEVTTENESQTPSLTLQSVADFEECIDENGNIYYYNKLTNESTWEKPSRGN